MNGAGKSFNLKKCLFEKSVEAYVLALETINRLSIEYRLETFCYLICNAWELLMKAKILDDAGKKESIYRKKGKGKVTKTISLRDCLNRIMPQKNDPVRRNLERIIELRDESVHLVINQVPTDAIRLFQASVINYHRRMNKWFGKSLSDLAPVGMMSIAYDMAPERWDMKDRRLQQKLGPDTAEFLTRYCAELEQELDELQRSPEFSVGIEYKITLTKNSKDADLALSSGPMGRQTTHILKVPKDPSTSHPFRQKELIEHLKSILPCKFNQFDVQCANTVYKVKRQSRFFYQGKIKGSPGQYSTTYADWLVKQYEKDSKFFSKTRSKAKELKVATGYQRTI